jgi:hypothetical protein
VLGLERCGWIDLLQLHFVTRSALLTSAPGKPPQYSSPSVLWTGAGDRGNQYTGGKVAELANRPITAESAKQARDAAAIWTVLMDVSGLRIGQKGIS